ncbi:MAG: hypothetical protein D3923_18245, partial [Candidatus Electrothrix sp. AR3]|nr:hypothetical protein [Candidatus Electrothrix sp. AR3]
MNTILLHRKRLCSLFAAVLCFFTLLAVCNTILPGVSIVDSVVQFDHSDKIQFFYSNGLAHKGFNEKYSAVSKTIEKNTKQKVRITLGDVPAKRVRLDFGDQPGWVKIYGLTLAGRYAKGVTLGPAEIFALFSSDSAETTVYLEKEYLALRTHKDSYLVCNQPLLRPKLLPLYSIPLLFSALFFYLLQQIHFSALAP